MPTASVVIPCYNAERFLEQTLASARAQTVSDIEIICVDDGSTDTTRNILARAAAQDSRIRVIHQENAGEGPARDAGLEAASGEWLYFLDADDIMEPQLLERGIASCEANDADLVVFRTLMLDVQTGEERLCPWSFKRDWMPDDCFCPADHPDHVLISFQNWVHNKLFRGSFVREHGLRMQHVHRTADLLFTCRALTEARRIALLDEPLHHYRVNNPQSAMSTSDSYPLDFYEGFVALREALEEAGTWELYHDSFVNWAIEGISINLRTTRSYEGFATIARRMQDEGLARLDVTGFPSQKADLPWCYDHVHVLAHQSVEETLFWQVKFAQTEHSIALNEASRERIEAARLQGEVERLSNELDAVVNSHSFKIGKAVTSTANKVRSLVHLPRARS